MKRAYESSFETKSHDTLTNAQKGIKCCITISGNSHKLMMAKVDVSYLKVLYKIESHDLLIMDNSGLQTLNHERQQILMDLMVDMHHKISTIF